MQPDQSTGAPSSAKTFNITCNAEELVGIAKGAAIAGDVKTVSRAEELLGQKVEVGFFDRHPMTTGVAIGVVAGAAVAGGTILGVQAYKRRQAAKLQAPSRLRRVG